VRALRPVLTLALASFARPTVSDGLALTPREREIGNYLLLGYTNREIALGLDSSPNTVRNQLAALFRKAEVSTRAELVARLLGR
jgi:DNA-binding CsgD family transcriptional regulator